MSFAAGRGFAFGGISPACPRFSTASQRYRFAALAELCARRARLRLRRHLARLHSLHYREPAFPVRRVGEVGREFVQVEVALRLLARVALLTMLGKECAELIVGRLGHRGWWLSPA